MILQKPMLGTQLDHSDSLNNPVLDLLFNEGHGDRVNDLSGYGNHGTLCGFDFPPTKTSGWNPEADGVALTFKDAADGVNSTKIVVPNSPSLDIVDGITIESRIKTSASSGLRIIVSKGEYGYKFRLNDGVLNVWDGSAVCLGTSNVADNVCHDVVYTGDGTNMKLYVDGIFENSELGTGPGSVANDVIIGEQYNKTCHFYGMIARVRILPRVMLAFEVMQRHIDPYGVYLQ